jgi:ligand-binding sensor domain-containing protein
VAIIGSLLYGYSLGERSAERETAVTAPVTVSSTTPPTTLAPVSPFEVTVTEFRRRASGHDVPEGATEYLNGNAISALAVAPDGSLWSAGPGGVIRWDPTDGSYERYTTPDGTGPIGASDIAVAPNGDVWVLKRDGLSQWNGKEWANDSQVFDDTLELTSLATTTDGAVWVASVDRASAETAWGGEPDFRIHRGEGAFIGDVETYEVPGWVERLEPAPDGSLWAIMEGADIWRFADDRWELVIDAGLYWVHDLAFEPGGGVLLTKETVIQRWADGAFTEDLVLFPEHEGYVDDVVIDGDGIAWVVATQWDETDGERRELIGLDDLTRYPIPDADPFNDVVAAGSGLWAGGDGLVGFDGATWSHLRIEDEPLLRWTESITVDRDGVVWIASEEEINRFDGAAWSALTQADLGLPLVEPDAWGWGWQRAWVAGHSDSRLWAGFGCDTAFLGAGGWQRVGRPPDLGDEDWCWFQQHMVGADGSLWLVIDAGPGPRIFRTDGSTWTEVTRPIAGYYSSLAVAEDGTLWATAAGVMRLDGDKWTTVLGGIDFETMTVAGDGSVWAAEACWECPEGQGRLWHMVDGVWTVERNMNVERLTTAPDGTVWAIGRGGYGPQILWRYQDVGVFRRVVAGDDLNSVAFAPDGSVWVAGEGRLLHLEDLDG